MFIKWVFGIKLRKQQFVIRLCYINLCIRCDFFIERVYYLYFMNRKILSFYSVLIYDGEFLFIWREGKLYVKLQN